MEFLARHPYCQRHLAKGERVPSVDVHHKLDRAEGGALFPGEDGLEALCKPCHSKETFGHLREDQRSSRRRVPVMDWPTGR